MLRSDDSIAKQALQWTLAMTEEEGDQRALGKDISRKKYR